MRLFQDIAVFNLMATLTKRDVICAQSPIEYPLSSDVPSVTTSRNSAAFSNIPTLCLCNFSYGSYVEFYNSFCGFCRRFSPTWKEIAEDLSTWRDVAIVSAIDCSVDENNGLCREFEVMAYPTIRYFSPHHTDHKKFGIPAEGQERRALRKQLVNFLKNETTVPEHWPSLRPLIQTNNKILFLGVKDIVDFIFIINLEENSTVGHEVALDLHSIDQILVRQVESEHVANKLGLAPRPSLTVVNRNNEGTFSDAVILICTRHTSPNFVQIFCFVSSGTADNPRVRSTNNTKCYPAICQ